MSIPNTPLKRPFRTFLQTFNMRFIAALVSIVSLAITSTRAEIAIPEGYWIKEVYPVLHPSKMAGDLPNGPLLNATLDCERKYKGVFYSYNIRGYRWDGITEKQIKAACNAGLASMTKWKFESWEVRDCGYDWNGNDYCVQNATMWHATVSTP